MTTSIGFSLGLPTRSRLPVLFAASLPCIIVFFILLEGLDHLRTSCSFSGWCVSGIIVISVYGVCRVSLDIFSLWRSPSFIFSMFHDFLVLFGPFVGVIMIPIFGVSREPTVHKLNYFNIVLGYFIRRRKIFKVHCLMFSVAFHVTCGTYAALVHILWCSKGVALSWGGTGGHILDWTILACLIILSYSLELSFDEGTAKDCQLTRSRDAIRSNIEMVHKLKKEASRIHSSMVLPITGAISQMTAEENHLHEPKEDPDSNLTLPQNLTMPSDQHKKQYIIRIMRMHGNGMSTTEWQTMINGIAAEGIDVQNTVQVYNYPLERVQRLYDDARLLGQPKLDARVILLAPEIYRQRRTTLNTVSKSVNRLPPGTSHPLTARIYISTETSDDIVVVIEDKNKNTQAEHDLAFRFPLFEAWNAAEPDGGQALIDFVVATVAACGDKKVHIRGQHISTFNGMLFADIFTEMREFSLM